MNQNNNYNQNKKNKDEDNDVNEANIDGNINNENQNVINVEEENNINNINNENNFSFYNNNSENQNRNNNSFLNLLNNLSLNSDSQKEKPTTKGKYPSNNSEDFPNLGGNNINIIQPLNKGKQL